MRSSKSAIDSAGEGYLGIGMDTGFKERIDKGLRVLICVY